MESKIRQDSFQGATAVVTGGAQGIGWALVQALAARGARVYGCSYSQASVEQALAQKAALPQAAQIHLTRCDVTDQAAVAAWIGEVAAENGRIDLLINNAAYVRWADVLEMPVSEAAYTMRVGYDGMVHTIKATLPLMQAAGSGHIVNIGSVAGRAFVGGASAAYAATKAAIDAYTQILQVELQGSPVCATIVRLGTVGGTDFFKKHVSNERMPPFMRFVPALTPPQVATAVLQAVERRREIVTLPRYLSLLTFIYTLSPRFARRVAQIGGRDETDYANVDWNAK